MPAPNLHRSQSNHLFTLGRGQGVRQRFLVQCTLGSNPTVSDNSPLTRHMVWPQGRSPSCASGLCPKRLLKGRPMRRLTGCCRFIRVSGTLTQNVGSALVTRHLCCCAHHSLVGCAIDPSIDYLRQLLDKASGKNPRGKHLVRH